MTHFSHPTDLIHIMNCSYTHELNSIYIFSYINTFVKILGTTTVADGMKIVLISRIAKKFDAKKGDVVVFCENNAGDIVIRKDTMCLLPE
jgi:hypothetical protein